MSGSRASASPEATGKPLRFQAGGTLGEDAFYVERPADHELPAALMRGELCYVLTTRQMGKSSLRVRAMKRLRAEGLACVSIDLTGIGTDDIEAQDWYYGLTSEIAEQLGLDEPGDFWDAHRGLGPVHCFSRYIEDEVLARVQSQVVIFIDEIDATLSLPFSRDDFFAAVRALYNRRAERPDNQRLTFCLLGVAAPGDLIADPTRTPFNIGRAIRLEDFTRDEMAAFRSGLAALGTDADARLDEIFAWTSGHPYMTQRVCEDLVKQRKTVDEVVQARFLSRGRTEDANLQYAEKLFGDRHDEATADQTRRMLQLYQSLLGGREDVLAVPGDPDQLALRITGMAAERERADGARILTARNRVFREVFDADWVSKQEAGRAIAAPLARWLENRRHNDFVMGGQALAELQRWAEGRNDLTAAEQAFLQAGIRVEGERQREADRRRTQRILIWVLGSAVAVLLAALLAIWWQYGKAEQAETEARMAATESELRRQSSLANSATRPTETVRRLLLSVQALRASTQAGTDVRLMAEQAIGDAVRDSVENRPLTGHTGGVIVAAFSPDGSRIVTASDDGTARVWSADGKAQPIVLRGHDGPVLSAAFSPDGSRIVTASDDATARVWSADGTAPPIVLRGHDSSVVSAAFSPDGSRIVTASVDATARVWSADGTARPVILRGHEAFLLSAAFSPDGSRIVTASWDGTARIWSADGKAQPIVLRGHEPVLSAAFSPDGSRIVTTSYDGTARVWSSDGKAQPIVLRRHDTLSAAFSPDGSRIVTASQDGTARVWTINVESLASTACAYAGRNFTRYEWSLYFPTFPYRKTCEQWSEGH